MLQLLSTLAGAATIFASTNIDDLLVVAAFFAEPRPHRPTIVAGQFLGIGALVLVSTLFALAALTLPGTVFPYLGTIPLGLGFYRLWQGWRIERLNASSPLSPSTCRSLRRHHDRFRSTLQHSHSLQRFGACSDICWLTTAQSAAMYAVSVM